MQELWDLLVSAQDNIGGIPTKFLEQKKEEIRLKKVHDVHVYKVYVYTYVYTVYMYVQCKCMSSSLQVS